MTDIQYVTLVLALFVTGLPVFVALELRHEWSGYHRKILFRVMFALCFFAALVYLPALLAFGIIEGSFQ